MEQKQVMLSGSPLTEIERTEMNSNLGSATGQMCIVEVLAAEVRVYIPLQFCFKPHEHLLVGETDHGPQSRVHTKYIAQFPTVTCKVLALAVAAVYFSNQPQLN